MKDKEKNKVKEQSSSKNITVPREMFDQVSRLSETIALQQKVIEKLMDEKKESKK